MTRILPRSSQISAALLALAWTSVSLGGALAPSPAAAAPGAGPYYVVELAAPVTEDRAVAGGVAWKCAGTTCVAGKATSRPLRVCRELQRKVGSVASFTTEGEALEADQLARCNA